MLKEIAEQPAAVANTLLGHFVDGRIVLDEQRLSDQELREIDKVFVVACGTAYHSGLLAKYAIEHWTRLPVEVELASEFRYRDPVLDRSTLVVAISQSGETADTLEAVRHAKEQKAKVLAICNTNGSQIPRECDAVLYTRAGPEIGVAATKTFLAQIAANYLVGLALAQARGTKYPDEVAREYRELEAMPELVARVLDDLEPDRRAGPRVCAVIDGVVPRPPRRLPGRPGGRAQAQGTGLHARRGLRRRRAQARPDRADRGRPAGHRRDALAQEFRDAARQAAVQHPRDPGPRRDHHRHRRGGRRDGAPIRRPPDRNPRGVNAFPAAAVHDPAAGIRRVGRRPGSPRPAATTSTSPATWPSPSPSNNPQPHIQLDGLNQDRIRTTIDRECKALLLTAVQLDRYGEYHCHTGRPPLKRLPSSGPLAFVLQRTPLEMCWCGPQFRGTGDTRR